MEQPPPEAWEARGWVYMKSPQALGLLRHLAEDDLEASLDDHARHCSRHLHCSRHGRGKAPHCHRSLRLLLADWTHAVLMGGDHVIAVHRGSW